MGVIETMTPLRAFDKHKNEVPLGPTIWILTIRQREAPGHGKWRVTKRAEFEMKEELWGVAKKWLDFEVILTISKKR